MFILLAGRRGVRWAGHAVTGQVRVLACARLGMRTCSVRPQPKEQTCCRWAVGLCAAWARTVYTVTAVRTRRVTATASWLRATGQPIRADGIGRMMAKLHCNIACMHYLYNKKRERSRSYGRPFDSKTDKKNDLPSSVNYVTGRCWYAYCHRWTTFVFVAHTTDSGNSRHIRVCRVCILLYYIFAGSDTLHIENWYND